MTQREKRTVHYSFKATPEEDTIIREKMRAVGVGNLSTFLRAMALNGYLLKLELPELHERGSVYKKYNYSIPQSLRHSSVDECQRRKFCPKTDDHKRSK